MNNNVTKRRRRKIIVWFIYLCVFAIGIYIGVSDKLGYPCKFVLQLIIGTFFVINSISISVDKNFEGKHRFGMAIVANLLFVISSTIFIVDPTDLERISIQIVNPIFLLLMVFFLYIGMVYCKIEKVKIKKGDDLSLLKAANYFIVFVFVATIFILKKIPEDWGIYYKIKKAAELVDYYYAMPLMMIQGLYELLDRKAKQLEMIECKNQPDCQKTPESQPTEYELDFPLLKGQDVKLVINPKK
jgi:hypothetical protein